MPEMILARVLRCRFCWREMACSPLTYAEHPFCTACLQERVRLATPPGGVRWRRVGDYFIRQDAEKTASNGSGRPSE